MFQPRDEAEALARGLELGLCEIAEVIAWADAQIARETLPPVALCDVSLSHHRYPQDVASLLRTIPGPTVRLNVGKLLLRLASGKLKANPARADQVASALFQMYLDDEIDDFPELKEIGGWAWDALDLADCGYIEESREQVIDRMATALDRVAAGAAVMWSTGIRTEGMG